MNFSSRTDWDLGENDLAKAIREARASGRELLDLTMSNPTVCRFRYDADALLKPLNEPEALLYGPNPFGMLHAREAVSRYYRDLGARVSPEHICLTTSTSEAYSFLFRLLCNPGDEVLVARPSYPLFDFLARLDDVKLVEYPLLYDHTWMIDLDALRAAITPRTRAIIVVHPNNPTGNFVYPEDMLALKEICAQRELALIADEVFFDYAIQQNTHASFAAEKTDALTFVLSGISKVCALPQMKLSWVAAIGPERVLRPALERLEVIADTFLSVNAPTQFALPHWLANRGAIQEQIRTRMTTNMQALNRRIQDTQADRLSLHGGWTIVLRVPRHVDDKPFAEAALERGVIVQPGEFYGLPAGRIVLSLLTPPDTWQQGLQQLPIG